MEKLKPRTNIAASIFGYGLGADTGKLEIDDPYVKEGRVYL